MVERHCGDQAGHPTERLKRLHFWVVRQHGSGNDRQHDAENHAYNDGNLVRFLMLREEPVDGIEPADERKDQVTEPFGLEDVVEDSYGRVKRGDHA